ncbi:hypothetical protein [Actinoplanes sp. NPDC023714]|uniref:hypothetical protein n=1 Tax=Actinoplanes sp. NPDC023714 TaxID=3154322 RepID=UPI0033E02645
MDARDHRISEQDPVLVFNYGDPSYHRAPDRTPDLVVTDDIFLRLIAYLLFADSICIPARHIVRGPAMGSAVSWAAPLLAEGIIQPARRNDVGTFEDNLCRDGRAITAAELARARMLDRFTTRSYLFDSTGMAAANRSVLLGDLSLDGAFRRSVCGGRFGRYAEPLSDAAGEYGDAGDGSVDNFIDIVARHAQPLRASASRWALARYYTTPVLCGVDTVNTREIPASAAALLIRGGVMASVLASPLVADRLSPVETACHRLRSSLPALPVTEHASRYCAALLEVRQAIPQARQLFSEVLRPAEIRDAEVTVAQRFERELNRQMRSRSSNGRAFTLVSSLIGGVGGAALGVVTGIDPVLNAGTGLAFGIATNIASNEIQNLLRERSTLRKRPWLIAVDHMERSLQRP